MNSYKMGYPKLQFSPLLIFLTLCFYLTISAGEILDHQEKQESKENSLKDYRIRFVGLFHSVKSINNTISSLNREIAVQNAEIVSLKSKIADQNLELENLTAKITRQQEKILKFKETVEKSHKLKSNGSWEDFDEFISGIQTEIKTGNSFNGSTLSQIKSRASQVGEDGSYTVVVFVNHLNETIKNFKIHDPYEYTNNPAPKSILPHTQEIFTFAKDSNSWVEASFSYAIPSARVRIAAQSTGGSRGAGLAFVSNGANMKTYYDTEKGIEGSWDSAVDSEDGETTDKDLSVSYKNLQARLFAKEDGTRKATLRIELF